MQNGICLLNEITAETNMKIQCPKPVRYPRNLIVGLLPSCMSKGHAVKSDCKMSRHPVTDSVLRFNPVGAGILCAGFRSEARQI